MQPSCFPVVVQPQIRKQHCFIKVGQFFKPCLMSKCQWMSSLSERQGKNPISKANLFTTRPLFNYIDQYSLRFLQLNIPRLTREPIQQLLMVFDIRWTAFPFNLPFHIFPLKKKKIPCDSLVDNLFYSKQKHLNAISL